MIRRFLMSMAAMVLVALPATAQTVDEIIAKNVAARGGMAKLKAVKTIKVTGKLSTPDGLEIPISEFKKRPEMVRQEFTIQGLTAVQAYDGKTGWQIMPFQGKKDAELMGEDDLKDIVEEADFDGPLVDYKAKGNKVELVGKEPLEGTDTYKLKVTLKDGDLRFFYLDVDTGLELKEESKKMIRGTEKETEQNIGDYKEVDGIMIPFSYEAGPKGKPDQKQKIAIEKAEVNVSIDDSIFKMPGAAPAKPEVKKPGEEKKN